MYSVGLTGNVAAGKSAVLRHFAAWGATVIDADVLAREAVAPGTPGLAAVAARFGPEVLAADGALDRAALRRRVMADPAERAALNAIVHPLVQRRSDALGRAAAAGGDLVTVIDVPLLFEVLNPADFDAVVLVDAPAEERHRRLVRDRGLGPADADALIRSQLPSDAKRARSAFVIDNTGTLEALRAEALAVWQALRARAARHALGAARPRSLLGVFAHPDDETFGPGPTLARCADAGLDVHLVCATGGEAARHRGGHADPDRLRRHREAELREACLVLGVRSLELLRERDGSLRPDDPAGAARIAGAIRRTRPDAIVTFGPDGVSGHPDHRAIHEWTRRAWIAEGRACPLWLVALTEEAAAAVPGRAFAGRPGPEIAARVDGRPWLDVKEAAIACHGSQRYPLPLDTAAWRARVGREVFGREGLAPGVRPAVSDLFLA
jgi:dephospho-CoA kinase